jgi:hypothetical protein
VAARANPPRPTRHRLDPPGALPGAFFLKKKRDTGALVWIWEHWYKDMGIIGVDMGGLAVFFRMGAVGTVEVITA